MRGDRPAVEIDGVATRVLVELLTVIDPQMRLGEFAGRLSVREMQDVDTALRAVSALDRRADRDLGEVYLSRSGRRAPAVHFGVHVSTPIVSRRGLLAGLAATGLLSACSTADPAPSAAATRSVTHPLGVTDVPVAPTRVLALDRRSTLPHLLALGITPVGALTAAPIIGRDFPALLDGAVDGLAVVPTTDGSDVPELEAVAALGPDLILGWSVGLTDVYPRLSAIAPTVTVDHDFADVSVGLRSIAAAVGRDAEAEAVVTGFDARLAESAAVIGGPGPVSILLGVGAGQFRVYKPGSVTVASWVADFGGEIVPDAATLSGEDGELFVTISPENLSSVTGATIVLLSNTGPDGDAAVREIETSPLWPTLPAVAGGRVVRLDSQAATGNVGFQGYEAVLGALTEQWTALPTA